MNQPQAAYSISEKAYALDPPCNQAEMDELVHGAVQGVSDSLASLATYIKALRDFRRNQDEIKAAEWLQEKLREVEDSSYWIDLNETAALVEERRPF